MRTATTALTLRLGKVMLGTAILTAALALAGCGSETQTPATAPVHWTSSKPNPLVGSLQAAVVERPAPDRAWIEVRWDGRNHGDECAVTISLPEGALLLEGEPARPLGVDEAVGTHRWLVEFPLGRPLDAVLRYCAMTPDGMRACEAAIRLTQE